MLDKSAAYHEAGHAVIAVASRFHCVYRDISVRTAYREAPFSVSKRKLIAAGKSRELAQMLADPEIAAESAMVFLGGGAAAEKYCGKNCGAKRAATTDALAKNDYEMTKTVLKDANIKTPLAALAPQAAEKVAELWPVITAFAEELFERKTIDCSEATEFISRRLASHGRAIS
jgi:hypothetical protein